MTIQSELSKIGGRLATLQGKLLGAMDADEIIKLQAEVSAIEAAEDVLQSRLQSEQVAAAEAAEIAKAERIAELRKDADRQLKQIAKSAMNLGEQLRKANDTRQELRQLGVFTGAGLPSTFDQMHRSMLQTLRLIDPTLIGEPAPMTAAKQERHVRQGAVERSKAYIAELKALPWSDSQQRAIERATDELNRAKERLADAPRT